MDRSKRKSKGRESRDVFLIFTEGDIEEIYFKQYRTYKLKSQNKIAIHIYNPEHTDPLGIVRDALAHKSRLNRREQEMFKDIFCVFDLDRTATDESIKKNFEEAKVLANKNNIKTVTSYPCFELWLLLHFEKFCKPDSCCKKVIDELKKHLNLYSKDREEFEKSGFFITYFDNIDEAIKSAKELESNKNNYGNEKKCPHTHTNIYKIIEKLGLS